MTRKIMMIFISAVLAVAFTAPAGMAGQGVAQKGPDGNDRKGKYTYRKVYKACYKRGEVDSKTPVISPADKTMAQWKRLFEHEDFEDFTEEFGCAQEWKNLSQDDIVDIYSYLYQHAADSPSPAKCQ
ncbi:MAG: hypothetical protein K9J83_00610 [Desulfarculaceae bacterium]|nr:hypothetical protein [Desulfarculaceae bacterium]